MISRWYLIALLLAPGSAMAIDCNLSLSPEQNAHLPHAIAGTKQFCRLLERHIKTTLKQAVKNNRKISSLTTDSTWNRYAQQAGIQAAFPGVPLWHLIQIKDGYLVFYRADIPTEFQYYLLIKKSEIIPDLKLHSGMALAAIAPFIAFKFEAPATDRMGFNAKVRVYTPVYPFTAGSIRKIIHQVEQMQHIKISDYRIFTALP